MCAVLLPPGDNPTAVNKNVSIYITMHGPLNVKRTIHCCKTVIFQPFCTQQKRILEPEIYYTEALDSKILYHIAILYVNWSSNGKRHNFDIAALRITSEFLSVALTAVYSCP
jgi:hypothetical protein